MPSSLLGLAPLLTVVIAACPTGPADWSRDGDWIAWTSAESADAPKLPADWLAPSRLPSPSSPPASNRYRIWATRFPSRETVLIEDSPHPLTSPSWSSDGRFLSYARFVCSDPNGEGIQRGRFELIVRDAMDSRRAVVIDPGLRLDAEARKSLPSIRLSPCPDGRRVIVPRPEASGGFWFVLLDDSGAVWTVEGADSPCWSPDGRHLAYFRIHPMEPREPYVTLHVSSPNRDDAPLPILDDALTPDVLAWDADGRSLLVVVRPTRGSLRTMQSDLLRVAIDGGDATRLTTLETIPLSVGMRQGQRPEALTSTPPSLRLELTMNSGRDAGVSLVNASNRDQVLRWGDLRTQTTYKRFHPLDAGLRLDEPAIAPDGRTLAIRVDDGAGAGLLALVDLETEEVSLIAPDEAMRRRWLDRLAATSLTRLWKWLPGDGAAAARPTALPILEQLDESSRRRDRGRSTRVAQSLLKDRPDAGGDGLDEFRLLFSYLDQDYESALKWLEEVEASSVDSASRLRWLGLRVQILIGMGRFDQARGVLDFLERETRSSHVSVEEAGSGMRIAEEPNPDAPWVVQLRASATELALRRSGRGRNDGRQNALDDEDGNLSNDASEFEAGRLPNVPFAPPADDARDLVPIIPDEFNPPGLRPRTRPSPPRPADGVETLTPRGLLPNP